MTLIPEAPPYEALATGLNQAVDEARDIAALAPHLGKRTALRTGFTITAGSVAEVNGIADAKGAVPAWVMPWTYAATWTRETVTVTVEFTTDPPVAPADAALIEVHGSAA
jgi:hypothetical protein